MHLSPIEVGVFLSIVDKEKFNKWFYQKMKAHSPLKLFPFDSTAKFSKTGVTWNRI